MSPASAGHRLGQIIGDWFEKYVVFRLLAEVASELHLDLRSRFAEGRTGRIIWEDLDGNPVDYDFVFVLPRTNTPVAFYESFWRSGTRHSMDKARDDSGKLRPMMDTYPTARALGIIAAGELTQQATDFIRSFGTISLFHISKEDVIAAWAQAGLSINYSDTTPEEEKLRILEPLAEADNDVDLMGKIGDNLKRILGPTNVKSLMASIVAKLSSLPSTVSIIVQQHSEPIVFTDLRLAAEAIIDHPPPDWPGGSPNRTYGYRVTFTNGDAFERSDLSWAELQDLHQRLQSLTDHVEAIVELTSSGKRQ